MSTHGNFATELSQNFPSAGRVDLKSVIENGFAKQLNLEARSFCALLSSINKNRRNIDLLCNENTEKYLSECQKELKAVQKKLGKVSVS